MRLVKMSGMAAIAVGALMTVLGATSASAVTSLEQVVLCKGLQDPCEPTNELPKGTVLQLGSRYASLRWQRALLRKIRCLR